jgi:adenosylmethionine-8-amino-7-oxononanoate aminotransferase
MKKNRLFENCATRGDELGGLLHAMEGIPIVGDVRGMGLMWGVELVEDRETRKPFDPAKKAAAIVASECMERGLVIYPGTGQIDGLEGDQFLIAPPLIVTAEQVKDIAERLKGGLEAAAEKLLK